MHGALYGLHIDRNLNRRKLKENVYSTLLFLQGCFFGVLRVDELLKSAKAFENLLNIKYRIILGRKGEAVEFLIDFDKIDYFHLVGLHYLSDMPNLKRKRDEIFNKIICGDITYLQLEKSVFFYSSDNRFGIDSRIKHFSDIENILDSNDTVFRYSKSRSKFSNINASFLLINYHNDEKIYLFLSDDKYRNGKVCMSFFPKRNVDYEYNQIKMTLLYKEKIFIDSGESIILYDRINKDNLKNNI